MTPSAHMARINARQRTIDACNKSVAAEIDEFAEARVHLAKMTPERREQLDREWSA